MSAEVIEMHAPLVVGVDRACDNCGGAFRVLPCEVRKAEKRGCSPPRFCSMACRNAGFAGAGNPKWRGGRYRSAGYVYIYAPDHPHATRGGYVMEHRLVMEARLGRYLDPAEVVHHTNHVRDDNRDENLELMPSGSAHRVHHGDYQDQPCGQCGVPVSRTAGHRRRWAQAFCSRKCAALAGSAAAKAARG